MTVSTTESRIGYNGNGATTVFAFPYRFLTNTDLVVTLVQADTTQVVQTLNTDYTVTGAGDDAGGTVTMVVPPATGQQLIIVRAVPLTQETDYISGDPFPAESHERALDKLTMISQRLENLISRSIRLSDADLLVSSTILPSPIANASLVWNGTGTAIVNGVGAGEFVGLSPYMEVVLGSVDAAEARTNLGAASAATLTALDAAVVKLTGAQTIADVKTFSSSPIVPTPTTAFQASTKAYADAASAVKTLVAPTSVNNVATIDIPNIPASARAVEVELAFVAPATDNVDLLLRTSTDNGSTFDTSAGHYQYANVVNTVGGSIAANNSASSTALMVAQALGTATNENGSGRVRMHYPGDAQYCCIDWEFTYRNQSSGTLIKVIGGGFRLAVADVDALRILFSTGNINTCRYSVVYW